MKVYLDQDLCVGCGLCEEFIDSVFRMNGRTADLIISDIPESLYEEVKNIADDCPVGAISLEEWGPWAS